MLPNPLRDRFGFTAHLEFYEVDELREVIARAALKLGLEIDQSALVEIASRSRGTPRIANRLLRRVRDFALVAGEDMIDISIAQAALALYEVDAIGLDRLDREILQVLTSRFDGKPVGLSTLAVAVGEEQDTIEAVVEPFLVRMGLIARTPRGRQATAAAYRHLGIESVNG
jgi:Holliday junction DNA helicase RuvB